MALAKQAAPQAAESEALPTDPPIGLHAWAQHGVSAAGEKLQWGDDLDMGDELDIQSGYASSICEEEGEAAATAAAADATASLSSASAR